MSVSPDVASKRGVTCPRGVRKAAIVASPDVGFICPRCGVTWREGASWHRQLWRQNVASLAHLASGSQVAPPDVAPKRGVTCPRGVREIQGARWRFQMWRQNVASLAYVASGSQVASLELYQGSRHWPHLASENVASERGVTCSHGVKEPRGAA